MLTSEIVSPSTIGEGDRPLTPGECIIGEGDRGLGGAVAALNSTNVCAVSHR